MIEPAASGDWVVGDVFELKDAASTVAILDEYEGVARQPPLFERGLITVTLDSGAMLSTWAYLYRGSLRDARCIASGDYLAPREPSSP
jgi:gamma-glutamylcyclotransferase (GGCT)/AIG2-like uncharacterized protein YtfP